MKNPVTAEDHQNSRMIANPFRLLDCSQESNGAAALIVSVTDRERDMRQPVVRVLGVVHQCPFEAHSMHRMPFIPPIKAGAVPRSFSWREAYHNLRRALPMSWQRTRPAPEPTTEPRAADASNTGGFSGAAASAVPALTREIEIT